MQNKNNSRRRFIKQAGLATVAANLTIFAGTKAEPMSAAQPFIHHVYFWLKNPGSKEDLEALLEGLRKLSKIDYIKMFHIGKPADTHRDVIERSYSISWMLHFSNPADQESYQTDPIHLKFIEDYSSLWQKVVVYDSVDV